MINVERAGEIDRRVLGRHRLLDRPTVRSPTSASTSAICSAAARICALDTVVALRDEQVDLSFTEPYFRRQQLAAGFDLFADNRDDTIFRRLQPVHRRRHAARRLPDHRGAAPDLQLYAAPGPHLQCPAGSSPFIEQQEGTRITSMVGQAAALRPARQLARIRPRAISTASPPTSPGSAATWHFSASSGKRRRTIIRSRRTTCLSLTGEAGNIWGIDQDVRIEDRYFVGGDNLRGFQVGGIGPRDSIDNDALGGDYLLCRLAAAGLSAGPAAGTRHHRPRVHRFRHASSGSQPTGPTVREFALDPSSRPASASRGNRRSGRSSSISRCPILREPYDQSRTVPRQLRVEVLGCASVALARRACAVLAAVALLGAARPARSRRLARRR